jgi:hypothetical protein
MNPDKIPEILDLAVAARKLKRVFNPMFVGEAGIGKSEIVQQWVAKQREQDPEFGFIDLRIAYYEGPDFVGYPYEYKDADGTTRMGHALPHFWPTKGRGLLLLEEPNRGNTMIQNCLMQLTDKNRKVGPTYELPEGWIIAAALNPEGSKYDVNNMDTALKNRFEEFEVEFSYQAFMNHIETTGWHKNVVNFVKAGSWVYKKPDGIGKEGKYISPRTLDRLNAVEMAGASDDVSKRSSHYIVAQSILGKHLGNEYWRGCWDDAPVTAQDILADKEKAINKLKEMAKANNNYSGDKISLTVDSIIEKFGGWYEGRKKDGKDWPHEEGTIDEPTLVAVIENIPSDHAINLIKGCAQKSQRGNISQFFTEFTARNPKCISIMRDHIKLSQALKK